MTVRIGYLDAADIGAATVDSGTVQAASPTLNGVAALPSTLGLIEQTATQIFGVRTIGVASPSSVLTRADGDARYASSGSAGVSSFNTRTGAVTLSSGDVTTALGAIPTSVTGLTGTQTVTAFKGGLSLVKGDVGLGSVDNTSDATKNVLSASKLTTARTINGTSFDGSANITINAVDSTARVPTTRLVSTTAPLTGGGALSADLTLAISAATGATPGSMSASDKSKLDGIASGATANTGTVTSVSVTTANGVSGTVATNTTTPAISLSLGAITPSSVASTGTVSSTAANATGSSATTYAFQSVQGGANGVSLGNDASNGYLQSWGGRTLNLNAQGNPIALGAATTVNSTLTTTGTITCPSLRINQTPTAGTFTPTSYITINLNGTIYRIPCAI